MIEALPTLNAALNFTSGSLAVAALLAIRGGRRERHHRLMLAALTASALFLVGYLTRVSIEGTTVFEGTGWVRTLYLSVLFTHMPLAALVVPLVLRTLFLASRERFDAHRRLARITFPLWMYVSITGVIVYVMLHHLPGPGRG